MRTMVPAGTAKPSRVARKTAVRSLKEAFSTCKILKVDLKISKVTVGSDSPDIRVIKVIKVIFKL
jgi:hypothetical protein